LKINAILPLTAEESFGGLCNFAYGARCRWMAYAPAQFAIVILSGRDHDGNSKRPGGCEIIQLGRRPVPPRACVVENRTYVRIFLADMPITPRKFERTVLARNYAAVA
jgi:hypothetical protein